MCVCVFFVFFSFFGGGGEDFSMWCSLGFVEEWWNAFKLR